MKTTKFVWGLRVPEKQKIEVIKHLTLTIGSIERVVRVRFKDSGSDNFDMTVEVQFKKFADTNKVFKKILSLLKSLSKIRIASTSSTPSDFD